MNDLLICRWLDNIPHLYNGQVSQPVGLNKQQKRKSLHQPPSPPISETSIKLTSIKSESIKAESPEEAMDPTPKKRKTGDPQRTPRRGDAGMSSRVSVVSLSTTSATSLPRSEGGIRSRSSSPRKQFMSLRLDDDGIECRQLSSENPPSVAADLVQDFCEIDMGIGILPKTLEAPIRDHLQQEGLNERLWRQAFGEEADHLPGNIPSWPQVTAVRDKAMSCFNEGHEEASWNAEVHHRLLERIFRGPNAEPGEVFDFCTCTTARPHRNYLPQSSALKMVDFCVYDNSNTDEQARRSLASRGCTLSVNHTDYAPLQLRPIILSIETKRPGENLDVAQLQIGVWQAAQWAFLRAAIEASLKTEDEATKQSLIRAAVAELGFIPGVIVQGHRWHFVFSTLEPKTVNREEDGLEVTVYRTILWTEQGFGSTQGMLKTYQIVAGVRRLAGWARDVYLPWHRKYVLAISDGG